MKNILILCVNYNSYEELGNYLHSIDVAAKKVCDLFVIDVFVGDNTTENQQQILTDYTFINVRVFPYYKNLGYVGCATVMLNEITHTAVCHYDFVAISNVDLLFSETFLLELNNINTNNVGWVVPSVYTLSTEKNENPYMLTRPTNLKIFLLQLLYTCPLVYSLYEFIYRFRHRERKLLTNQQQNIPIYAGHGSIMIFTKHFFRLNTAIHFPGFMYGEELFFAELVRQSKLQTVYYPQLIINNIGNVSTKLLGNKRKCHMSKESLSAIRQLYFADKRCS